VIAGPGCQPLATSLTLPFRMNNLALTSYWNDYRRQFGPNFVTNNEKTIPIKMSSSDAVNASLMTAIMEKIIGVPVTLNVECY